MVLSYEVSVLLLAVAIFGLWCFIKDLWAWIVQPYLLHVPQVSFLIIVKNIEQDIEEMLRHLMLEIELADPECDVVVVVDARSDDLTYPISERLAREFSAIRVVRSSGSEFSMQEALANCRGGIVHVLDTVHRIDPVHFIPIVCWLLKEPGRRVPVRHS